MMKYLRKQDCLGRTYDLSSILNNKKDIVFELDNMMEDVVAYFQKVFGEVDDNLKGRFLELELPYIVISEECPVKEYGEFDVKEIIDEIIVMIGNGCNNCLENCLDDMLRSIQQIDEAEGRVDLSLREIVEDLEQHKNELDNDVKGRVEAILRKIKNRKKSSRILGIYDNNLNRIVLYPFNMANNTDAKLLEEKIKSTFVHELFHAVHYFMMGKNEDIRYYAWCYEFKYDKKGHNARRKTVIESLARYVQYRWCQRQGYTRLVRKMEAEMEANFYPAWPYAGAKVFMEIDKNGRDDGFKAANEVLKKSLDHALKNRSIVDTEIYNFGEFWKNAYRALDWCGKAW